MMNLSSIRWLLAMALLGGAGCARTVPLEQTPLAQDGVDQFLSGGRDARYYGITTYPDPAGPRFEFANRPHPDQAAQLDFVSPKSSPFPVVEAKSAITDRFPMLLDSSARQNWSLMGSAQALEYRIFSPPTGEYADHVVSAIPGYAGVGNKLILDELHVESPIFYVPPATGGLGPLARTGGRDRNAATRAARESFAGRIPVAMGAAAMRPFAYVRFDFPGRSVRFSSSGAYKPANASAVRANLPMLDWRGRPAVQATLDGESIALVIDTAGDFDLALPGEPPEGATGALALGGLRIDEVPIASHASLGLPEKFSARLGLGVLARFVVTLDHKNRRVWFEDPCAPPAAEPSAPSAEDETPEPIQYRGVKP